MSFTRLNE
jgi:hypothetical protein